MSVPIIVHTLLSALLVVSYRMKIYLVNVFLKVGEARGMGWGFWGWELNLSCSDSDRPSGWVNVCTLPLWAE